MVFMIYSKKTISAAELQRQLNHSKYDTISRLMHKIRSAMGKRNAIYQLGRAIEFTSASSAQVMKDILKKQLLKK